MQRPVDVVYLIGQLSYGGTERQLLLLVKNLNRTKFRPSVICLSEQASLADWLRKLDCPTVVLRRSEGRLRTLLQVCRLVRQIRPAILHSFAFTSRAGILAAKVTGSSFKVTSIRTNPYWSFFGNRLLDRFVMASSDLLLANSHQALTTLKSHGMISRSPARVIYNGLDLHTFDNQLADLRVGTSFNRDDYLPAEAGQTICTVSSLRSVKGVELLLKAFALVFDAIPGARLWVVGDGPMRSDLESLAKNLKVDAKVTFLGLRSDVPAILRRATIGVNSSRIEGLCNAIIEYMAAQLPVVATNTGGNPELVIHGKTGLLVPPADHQAMADAIIQLLENTEVALAFGKAGRKRVEEEFTVERMVRETEGAYEGLLQLRNHRPSQQSDC